MLKKNILLIIIITTLILACDNDKEIVIPDYPYPLAEENNIDSYKLADAYKSIETIEKIRSLVVARNGVIVSEEYYNGTGSQPDSVLDVRSVTKSISSTLIGIAIDKNFIKNADQTLEELIGTVEGFDSEFNKITLHNLLTMTAGFEWHEIAEPSEFPDFISSKDQLDYIFSKSLTSTPGSVFDYSDGAAHLVSVVLEEATGLSSYKFAKQYLFEPLGISGFRLWYEDNRGYNYGGVGLCIGPHDMIKIGELYLKKGLYENNRIVSEEWITNSTSSKISTNNTLPYFPDYGYYWWLGEYEGKKYHCAIGYGGQFIFVVPVYDLVITATCDFRSTSTEAASNNWTTIITAIMTEILPAVRD